MFNTTLERYNDFMKLIELHGLNLSDDIVKWLADNSFFTAPASTKYHGAYTGGLYDHSRAVYERLVKLTKDNNLYWQRPQSPFIIGMFHDLCKCDQYVKTMQPLAPYITESTAKYETFEYNTNTLLKGHGTKSLMILSRLMTLTEEEMLCIRYHMGAYGNDAEQKTEWAGFDAAIHRYENVLWVHHADQLASKVDNI